MRTPLRNTCTCTVYTYRYTYTFTYMCARTCIRVRIRTGFLARKRLMIHVLIHRANFLKLPGRAFIAFDCILFVGYRILKFCCKCVVKFNETFVWWTYLICGEVYWPRWSSVNCCFHFDVRGCWLCLGIGARALPRTCERELHYPQMSTNSRSGIYATY